MTTPPFLKAGDKIGIVSTARKISLKELVPAMQILRSWELEPVVGETIGHEHHQFAGDDKTRAADFQKMLDNPEIRAIICARGGYGTVRIVDRLDFSAFRQQPKWIIGFSDITVLHAHISSNFSTESLHATMPVSFTENSGRALESLRKALFGKSLHYTVDSHPLNIAGHAEGVLTGGNLSVLYSLAGSASEIDTSGKILFLEDLDEYLYHIDRMMMNLFRSGKFTGLSGLIIGGMTRMNDNEIPFGKSAEEIIFGLVKELNIPVCFGFPAGHISDNHALIIGRNVSLQIDNKGTRLNFDDAYEAMDTVSRSM